MKQLIEENRILQTSGFLLFILTLFYGADFMSVWEVEARLANSALANLSEGMFFGMSPEFSPLSELMVAGGLSTVGMNELGIRLSNMLLLASSLFLFYTYGKKFFGLKHTIIAILMAIGSFPLLLIGKIVSTDIWLFFLQLLIFFLTIYQLKKPQALILGGLVFLNIFLVLIQPLSALIFSLIFYGFFLLLHKDRKRIALVPCISIPVQLGLVIFFNKQWIHDGFLMSYGTNLGYYFILVVAGLFGAFGFVPTALYHTFKRLFIKEEMAIITGSALVAGLLSCSFLPHMVLLFLIGKQMDQYDEDVFPYRNAIRVFTIIQVVLGFFIAMMLILNGFTWFGGEGFRKTMIFGTPIWAFGIYTLVSLYSNSRKHLFLSVFLSGWLFNFLFWIQIMPLWEAERNITKDMVNMSLEKSDGIEDRRIYLDESYSNDEPMEFYRKTYLDREIVAYVSPTERDSSGITFYIQDGENSIVSNIELDTLVKAKGRSYPWEEMGTYYLLKKK